ncbi:outer membrane lipoprotein chaperone LolA [Nitrogeniibacter aestuarii]|uniref:outer membrane lipoprotein chaperone LolA n=1 Tax=Nitrogeniibacter aestuarii TaxID=2815343 RepID=UPI001E33F24C|nr:outer membrane lipoprotein chaperone LolA [Nitrogeniibacter aestuarii]
MRFAGIKTLLVGAVGLGVSLSALAADGVVLLRQFVDSTHAAKGTFVQSVYRANGGRGEESKGDFIFERPGKFRWNYSQPYPQLLVGDGHKLWSYDPDLAQVTVKTMGDALGGTPAAILSGAGDLDKSFTLENAGEGNGLTWAVATPKASDSSFASMKLGFDGARLVGMEIRDNFGQITILKFTKFEANPVVAEDAFVFTPPAGVDVIGDL